MYKAWITNSCKAIICQALQLPARIRRPSSGRLPLRRPTSSNLCRIMMRVVGASRAARGLNMLLLLLMCWVPQSESFALPSLGSLGGRITSAVSNKGELIRRNASPSSDQDNGEKRLKVLCLHGYLSSSKLFRLQLRRLVDEASHSSDFGNNPCMSNRSHHLRDYINILTHPSLSPQFSLRHHIDLGSKKLWRL